MKNDLNTVLATIPDGLRLPLLDEFEQILTHYRGNRWEQVGLKAGKLCEIIYCVLDGYTSGVYLSSPSKPQNMLTACQNLEQRGSNFPRTVRIQMPRLLIAVYELRNNRAIGHVGGEVDPNHMDAELFLRCGKWLMAELVRVFGALDVSEAQNLVESVTAKLISAVWDEGKIKRVLNNSMSKKDQVLVLLYTVDRSCTATELCQWTQYSNASLFRSQILGDLHSQAFLDFDRKSGLVTLSPTGALKVETSGLLEFKIAP